MNYNTIPQTAEFGCLVAQPNFGQQNSVTNSNVSQVRDCDKNFECDYFDFDDLAKFNILSLFEKKINARLDDIKARSAT